MAITPLPSLYRTAPTFKTDTDRFFGEQLPQFSTQVEAARVAIIGSEAAAAGSAADAAAHKIAAADSASQAAADRTQTGLDRIAASDSAAAALASKNAASEKAAEALASLVSAKNIYYGPLASDPTLRPDGSARVAGDRYYSTASSAEKVFSGSNWGIPNVGAVDLANATDPAKGASLVGYDGRTVDEQLKQVTRIENIHALRDFWKALYAFHTVENSKLAIASYGDSVSGDICGALGVYLRDLIGRSLSNPTSFSVGSGLGTSPSSPAYTGGANLHQEALGAGPCTYLPTGNYYDIPVGGTVTFNSGGQGTGFEKITCYLAKIPGGGTATVDLLDEALAIVATQVVNTENATIDATKVDFTGLTHSIKYRLRVTGSVAPVVALGIAMIKPRGITQLAWGYGGTTLDLQNTSPKTIFDFINTDLGVSLFISECKGEAASATGYSGLITRLSAFSASKLLVGTRPDSSSVAQQTAETRWTRQAAISAGYAYVDAGHMLKDYAELTRLGWGGDGTHVALETAWYVAALIYQAIPIGALAKLYATRDVHTTKVMAHEFSVHSPASDQVAQRITFAKNMGGGEGTKIRIFNSIRVHSGADTASSSMGAYGSGWAVFSGGDTFGDLTARAVNLAPGSTTLSTMYRLRLSHSIEPGSYLVADLPSASNGAITYASNGRKAGEAAGAGTGVMVYLSGGAWRVVGTDAVVSA